MEFQQIYKEYYLKILKYLTQLLDNKEEAEDLTQEVFIRVNSNLDKFEGRSSLSTWIYKIASNLAKDHFKSCSFKKELNNHLSTMAVKLQKGDLLELALENKDMNNCNELPRRKRRGILMDYLYYFRPKGRGIKPNSGLNP